MEVRQRLQFRIGDAFPADEPVARWLTVLALASNDFLRIFEWSDDDPGAGKRVFAFRVQAATLHEIASHLDETLTRWQEIRDFMGQLEPEAQKKPSEYAAPSIRTLLITLARGSRSIAT